MIPSELCFNLWFIVDIGTGLCYGWCGRVYSLQGSDQSKTAMLKQLAETDHVTASKLSLPKHWKTVVNGTVLEGKLAAGMINNQLDQNLDYFMSQLEANLPSLPKFDGKGSIRGGSRQQLPNEPLYVSTLLMENRVGELRPYTTAANKEWIEAERWRMQ